MFIQSTGRAISICIISSFKKLYNQSFPHRLMVIQAHIIGSRVSSNTKEAQQLLESSRFGEKNTDKVVYSLVEAFYLLEKNKISILDSKGKELTKQKIEQKFERLDKKFKTKYAVFSDLRMKGYIVKSALKFGADFRVYDKGTKVGKDHSRWFLI